MKYIHMLLAGLLLVLLPACSVHEKEKRVKDPIPVKVIAAQVSEDAGQKNYVGTVHPSKVSSVSCRYSGTLVELKVSQGDLVARGDVVAVVESQSVRSMYESSKASLAQAEDGYERVLKVHGSGSVADVKLVEVRTKLAQAKAAARAAEQALEDCTVRAPFTGVVGEVYVDEGVDLSPVQPIVRIFDISSVEIRFPVPENEIGGVRVGEKAIIAVPALAQPEKGSGKFSGSVTAKGITASALSHTYECTLRPDSDVDGLMPGMVCKVRLEGGSRSGIIVPASVIRSDGSGRYVWTVGEGDRIEKTYIETGGYAGKGVIVVSGLSDGDRVLTEGMQKVSSGMKVRIVE